MRAGQEYEAILSEKLRCAGIPFFSEDKLREEGFFKTPDVKLEVHSQTVNASRQGTVHGRSGWTAHSISFDLA